MIKTTEKRTVEKNITVYVACDGAKFDSYDDCVEYEREMIFNSLDRELERIPELDDVVPLNYDDNPYNESDFRWYRIRNQDEIHLCNKILDNYDKHIDRVGIIAVEKLNNEIYVYFYEDCVNAAKEFFKLFGLDMKLEFAK